MDGTLARRPERWIACGANPVSVESSVKCCLPLLVLASLALTSPCFAFPDEAEPGEPSQPVEDVGTDDEQLPDLEDHLPDLDEEVELVGTCTICEKECPHCLETAKAAQTPKREGHWSGLPLFWERIPDDIYNVPPPFGVNVQVGAISRVYRITSLRVGVNGGDLRTIKALAVETQGDTQSYAVKVDTWVFPFLNLYGVVGGIDSNTSTTVTVENLLPGGTPTVVELPLERSGHVYGGGAVLALGFRGFFAAGFGTYTIADLGEDTDSISSIVAGVRVGYGFNFEDFNLQLWAGCMYWATTRDITGDTTLPNGTKIDFEVEQEPDTPTHPVVGMRLNLFEHLEIMLEGGLLDDVTYANLIAGVRF
jgi:hypothetical protein